MRMASWVTNSIEWMRYCEDDFLRDLFPHGVVTAEGKQKWDVPEWRAKLGMFGVTGNFPTQPIKIMSPGFRARLVFCLMSLRNPHMLLLDVRSL